LQKGLSFRLPTTIRFVYEDRPGWWPDSIPYSSDAAKGLGRDVLEPLHKTLIEVRARVSGMNCCDVLLGSQKPA
jgi:hypothetical protein